MNYTRNIKDRNAITVKKDSKNISYTENHGVFYTDI